MVSLRKAQTVLSIYLVGKFEAKIWPVLTGGVLLCLALGIYQAFLGTACVVAFFYIMTQILEKEDINDTVVSIRRSLEVIVLGGVLYTIVTKIVLYVTDLGLTDFHGASDVGVGSILSSMVEVLKGMYSSMCSASYINILDNNGLDIAIKLIVLVIVVLLTVKTFRESKIKAVLFIKEGRISRPANEMINKVSIKTCSAPPLFCNQVLGAVVSVVSVEKCEKQ